MDRKRPVLAGGSQVWHPRRLGWLTAMKRHKQTVEWLLTKLWFTRSCDLLKAGTHHKPALTCCCFRQVCIKASWPRWRLCAAGITSGAFQRSCSAVWPPGIQQIEQNNFRNQSSSCKTQNSFRSSSWCLHVGSEFSDLLLPSSAARDFVTCSSGVNRRANSAEKSFFFSFYYFIWYINSHWS